MGLVLLTAGVSLLFGGHVWHPPEKTADEERIATSREYDVETLVRDIFVKGGCENVHNIRSIGNEAGVGYFEQGLDVIGLANGVILSTGDIRNAEGPNTETDVSSFFEIRGNDRDLRQMATDKMYDPIGLEFDFVPLDSFVTFRYVFASEEYCEFVGSIYNDVFGFFISGPGIEGNFSGGAKNVALIPGTEDEVSINNVNHQSNTDYFIQNYLSEDAQSCRLEFQPSDYIGAIEYDGFTKPMVASLKLIPCETYHIRLVISDVGDGFFDSAVFLEAGSFNIGGAVTISGLVEGSESLIEGCSEGYLVFEREDLATLDYPVSVHFAVSPNSTAREGEDFEPLPTSATIPPGETTTRVPIHAINDRHREDREYLLVELDIPCSCYHDSTIVYIEDAPPVSLMLPEAIVCQTESAELLPEIRGGTAPFSYRWEDGSTGETRIIRPDGPEVFRLTVTDHCGEQAVDSAFLRVQEPPRAVLEGDARICAGDTTFFALTFTGTPPWSFQVQRDDQLYEPVGEVYASPYLLPVAEAGDYRIVDFFDAGCRGEFSGSARLSVWNIEVEADIQPNTCYGLDDGHIRIRIDGGTPPYAWKWAQGPENVPELVDLTAGRYDLEVWDENGCSQSFFFDITAPDPLEEIAFDCEDLRNSTIELSAGGGTPPYRYSVDGAPFAGGDLFEALTPGQSYRLEVADAHDCRLEQDFTMPIHYERMATLPESIDMKLGAEQILRPDLQIPEHMVANVRWSPGFNLSCVNCLEPTLQAWEEQAYTLYLIDIFGCSDQVSTRVQIDRSIDLFIPTAFSPNGDGRNDRFTIYANPVQVRRVRRLQIYDRWGNLLYQAGDFSVNDEDAGWDGLFRGRPMNAGSYVYHAELELIDGSRQDVNGQVNLMK